MEVRFITKSHQNDRRGTKLEEQNGTLHYESQVAMKPSKHIRLAGWTTQKKAPLPSTRYWDDFVHVHEVFVSTTPASTSTPTSQR